jgi:alpha-1,2-mannosyltransferase
MTGVRPPLSSPAVRFALAAGALVIVVSGLHTLYGLRTGGDLLVYWKGGWSILHGQTLYGAGFAHEAVYRALPFTYTPFAAMLFVPLALVSPGIAMVCWTVLEVGALAVLVVLSFPLLLKHLSGRRKVAAALLLWCVCLVLQPLQDEVVLGQVDVFITLACFADVVVARTRWPRGMLIGVATAVKLTPAVFMVHLAITRQWSALRNAVLSLAACWGLALALLPSATLDYFLRGVMLDTGRVGSPRNPVNQSLSGLVARLALPAHQAIWIALCAVVAVYGLNRARRAHELGHPRTAALLVAMVSLLVSPISWLHHAMWVVPLLGVLLTNGRRTMFAAGVVLAGLLLYAAPTLHGWRSEWYVLAYVLALVALPFEDNGRDSTSTGQHVLWGLPMPRLLAQ